MQTRTNLAVTVAYAESAFDEVAISRPVSARIFAWPVIRKAPVYRRSTLPSARLCQVETLLTGGMFLALALINSWSMLQVLA